MMKQTSPKPARRWNPRSLALIVGVWAVLQIGGLFSPGLLDDVDSVYIEIARSMLHRHDFVTPYIDGIRFFDKPPLMYWLAAGSMAVFGEYDWAARIPIILAMLALLLAVYALGLRLFATLSPPEALDRGALYSALAVATGIGPYLYTRFFIPDIPIALWMTLSVHLTLVALERVRTSRSTWATSLCFAAILALNVLTKGLIGLVFPVAFVFLYLLLTKQFSTIRHLHPIASTAVFAAIAAPWHILAALRTPPISLPAGLGLPAHGGWAWFYLYNEHIARFLQKRIPHDYGQTPVWLFWLFAFVWMMPWTAFLPASLRFFRSAFQTASTDARIREAALALTLWAAIVLGFFTLSARQEYYSIPALPALGLLAGGILACADTAAGEADRSSILRWSLWLLVPIATVTALVCAYFAIMAPAPAPGTDIYALLTSNPELYNLSLGHLYDLTGAAMGLFRAPLAGVAVGMIALGPIAYLLRRSGRTFAANLALAGAMIVILTCAHEGLARFYPILGSKQLALDIAAREQPGDLTILDGELTSGSSVLFYTRRPVHLVDGRVNGLWYGSFWPDAPQIFEDEASLRRLWASPQHIFLFTYHPDVRTRDLMPLGTVRVLASAGGKTVLTNFQ
jgi:4-amino-4-deoxy-L-arabinose transferase-like glycosyltransferase